MHFCWLVLVCLHRPVVVLGNPEHGAEVLEATPILHNSYLAGSIYDEQIYGYECLGIFGNSACSIPIPILSELHMGHLTVTINSKRAVAAPQAITSPMAAPEQDQHWALTMFQPCVRANSIFPLCVSV